MKTITKRKLEQVVREAVRDTIREEKKGEDFKAQHSKDTRRSSTKGLSYAPKGTPVINNEEDIGLLEKIGAKVYKKMAASGEQISRGWITITGNTFQTAWALKPASGDRGEHELTLYVQRYAKDVVTRGGDEYFTLYRLLVTNNFQGERGSDWESVLNADYSDKAYPRGNDDWITRND